MASRSVNKGGKPAKAPVAAPAQAAEEIAAPVTAEVEAAAEIVAEAPAQVEEAAAPVVETIEEGIEVMATNTAEAFASNPADRFQAAFGDVNERAKTAFEKSAKLVEELTEFTKGNVEAIVASSKIAAKGAETLGQDAAEYGRKSFEEASAALKSFAEVKSPTDFFKLQGDFARAAFDSWVAESSKTSEAVIKLAGEVAEPITTRYSVAAERVKGAALV